MNIENFAERYWGGRHGMLDDLSTNAPEGTLFYLELPPDEFEFAKKLQSDRKIPMAKK
ncbi:hypothetical protein GCM10023156_65260 [Novipirellula rosea]|uniref:Uncharacterized protein n=1 Tax=Novipirellula rosea TaxID=1031540 RepID=A0ABP8NQS7_9BACT|tara:strand:+ start:12432 stop:12605 length:174 start_codon:yes stop_codon:yes gene_type:complete